MDNNWEGGRERQGHNSGEDSRNDERDEGDGEVPEDNTRRDQFIDELINLGGFNKRKKLPYKKRQDKPKSSPKKAPLVPAQMQSTSTAQHNLPVLIPSPIKTQVRLPGPVKVYKPTFIMPRSVPEFQPSPSKISRVEPTSGPSTPSGVPCIITSTFSHPPLPENAQGSSSSSSVTVPGFFPAPASSPIPKAGQSERIKTEVDKSQNNKGQLPSAGPSTSTAASAAAFSQNLPTQRPSVIREIAERLVQERNLHSQRSQLPQASCTSSPSKGIPLARSRNFDSSVEIFPVSTSGSRISYSSSGGTTIGHYQPKKVTTAPSSESTTVKDTNTTASMEIDACSAPPPKKLKYSEAAAKSTLEEQKPSLPETNEESDQFCSNIQDVNIWPALDGGSGNNPEPNELPLECGPDIDGNWREGLTTWKRYEYVWTSAPEKFNRYQEAKFEVGPDAQIFLAHRLMLAVSCDYFSNQSSKSPSPIKFPKLDPEAFLTMLEFVYSGKFNPTDIRKISAVMDVANAMGCRELTLESAKYLGDHVSVDNVVELYYFALSSKDEALKEIALKFILNNPHAVLLSNGTLKCTEEALCSLLEYDNWQLDELIVFEAVKRWAQPKARIPTEPGPKAGRLLREAMGRAIYSIRFVCLDWQIFGTKIDRENPGLFTDEELSAFLRYFLYKDSQQEYSAKLKELGFNLRPRLNMEHPNSPSSTTPEVVPSRPRNISPDINVQPVPVCKSDPDGRNGGKSNQSSSTNLQDGLGAPPAKKRKKRPSGNSINHPEISTTTEEKICSNEAQDFQCFVRTLLEKDDVALAQIKTISVILIFPAPAIRICLPNLKEFNLELLPRSQTPSSCGKAMKDYMRGKGKFLKLQDILFFNASSQTDSVNSISDVFKDILSKRIDVSVTFKGVKMLCVNHESGTLLINVLRGVQVQTIVDTLEAFPLKKLLLSECGLVTLNPLKTDLLEVVVARRTRMVQSELRAGSDLLARCTKLREVCWDGKGIKSISTDLFDRNPDLRKLAVSRCSLILPSDILMRSNQQNILLQELYLDSVDWSPETEEMLPKVFPYLKRIVIYGKKCNAPLLHKILQMPLIEFIFIWEMDYCSDKKKKKGTRNILSPEAEEVQKLLRGVLGEKVLKANAAFILERESSKPGTSSAMASGPTNPFDPSTWKGTKLIGQGYRYDAINVHDYENFAHKEFYPVYDDVYGYRWFETAKENEWTMWQKRQSQPESTVESPAPSPEATALPSPNRIV